MRNNGKTYRAVLRAVADASDGLEIIYVSNTVQHLDIAHDFVKIFTSCIEHCVHRGKDGLVSFASGGSIYFMTLEKYIKLLNDGYFNSRNSRLVEDK